MRPVREAVTVVGNRLGDSPLLFVVGLLVAALTGGSAVLAVLSSSASESSGLFGLLREVGTFLVTFELLRVVATGVVVGVAAPSIAGDDRPAFGRATPGRVYEFLVGALLFRAVGIGVAAVVVVALLGLYLPVVTGLQAVGYAAGVGSNETMFWVLIGSVGLVVSGLVFAAGSVGLASGHLYWGGRYGSGIRQGLAAGLASPMRAFAHGAVVAALVAGPLVLAGLAVTVAGPVGALVALLFSGAFAYATLPVYRVAASERETRGGRSEASDPRSVRAALPSRSRVALAVAVLAVGLLGGATLRVTDARPMDTSPPGFDADRPGESFVRSLQTVGRRSHVAVLSQTTLGPDGEEIDRVRQVVRYDRGDREFESYWLYYDPNPEDGAPWGYSATYAGEGSVAFTNVHEGGSRRPRIEQIRANESIWRGRATPKYRSLAATSDGASPSIENVDPEWSADRWEVTRPSEGTVAFETPTGEAFLRATTYEQHVVDGTARVVIDAETGYVRRVSILRTVRRPGAGEGEPKRVRKKVRVELKGYASTDVTRPPGAPDPGAMALFYDALFY